MSDVCSSRRGRRPVTREMYDLLIDGYREQPGNASFAARAAGCDRRTAARGWNKGWLDLKNHEWAVPIRDVIKNEMLSARAERQRLQEKEKEAVALERSRARQDAVKSAGEEAQAAQVARTSAIAMGGVAQSLIRTLLPLLKKLPELVEKADLTAKETIKAIGDTAFIVRSTNDSIRTSLEIERIRLGEPTDIIGIQSQLEEVTAEEAVEELLGIERTLRRAVVQTAGQTVSYTRPDGTIEINIPAEAYDDGSEDGASVIELHTGKRRKKQEVSK